MLGSGSIIIADDTVSIPHMALRTARFYHHESCGKCTPCREGTNWTVKMLERVVRGDATPMDLDVCASIQENIIGNCLCVLGDSMAMPVGSMVRKFRDDFERAIEEGRASAVLPLEEAEEWAPMEVGVMERPRIKRGGERDHVRDRRRRGRRARGGDARRRREAGRRRDPGVLLRAEARRSRRGVPDVPGRDRGNPEAPDRVLDPGARRDGRVHAHRPGAGGAGVGGRVPAHQPSARLPGVRQGRGVPAAGHRDGMGAGPQPLHRPEAPLPEADPAVAAGQDRPRALHPVLPLRPLQPGDLRGRAAAAPGARRPHVRRHVRRPPLHRPLPRQHHRAVPGGGADLAGVPVPGPPVGDRGRGLDLHAVPVAVQRAVHRPRRARRAGDGARQPGRRRRVAVRQGPVRLPDDRLA